MASTKRNQLRVFWFPHWRRRATIETHRHFLSIFHAHSTLILKENCLLVIIYNHKNQHIAVFRQFCVVCAVIFFIFLVCCDTLGHQFPFSTDDQFIAFKSVAIVCAVELGRVHCETDNTTFKICKEE